MSFEKYQHQSMVNMLKREMLSLELRRVLFCIFVFFFFGGGVLLSIYVTSQKMLSTVLGLFSINPRICP